MAISVRQTYVRNGPFGSRAYTHHHLTQYSTAKAAITGLTRTLAIEGKKYNILANVIAPSAGTAMTATIWPQEMIDAFKPEFIAPVVGYLTSADNEETSGDLFEILGGWAAQTRWQRSGGHGFPTKKPLTPEDVVAKWANITTFGGCPQCVLEETTNLPDCRRPCHKPLIDTRGHAIGLYFCFLF